MALGFIGGITSGGQSTINRLAFPYNKVHRKFSILPKIFSYFQAFKPDHWGDI